MDNEYKMKIYLSKQLIEENEVLQNEFDRIHHIENTTSDIFRINFLFTVFVIAIWYVFIHGWISRLFWGVILLAVIIGSYMETPGIADAKAKKKQIDNINKSKDRIAEIYSAHLANTKSILEICPLNSNYWSVHALSALQFFINEGKITDASDVNGVMTAFFNTERTVGKMEQYLRKKHSLYDYSIRIIRNNGQEPYKGKRSVKKIDTSDELYRKIESRMQLLDELGDKDASSAMMQVRSISEMIIECILKAEEMPEYINDRQIDRLNVLKESDILSEAELIKFHRVRSIGNSAAHDGHDSKEDAVILLDDLKSLYAEFEKKYILK